MTETGDASAAALQRRNRFIIAWVLGTALWLAALLISEAAIRPAPSFHVMAPLAVTVPALGLAIGLLVLRRRR